MIEHSVRPEPEASVRPDLVGGRVDDAELLARGFAEHVVRWATRLQTAVIADKEVVIPDEEVVIPGEEVVIPGEEVVIPGEEVVIPDEEVVIPGEEVVIPGSTRDPGCPPVLDKAALEILRRCAHATSIATSNGHVCVLLSELAGISPSLSGGGLGRGQQGRGHSPDGTTLRTTLLDSGVVGTPSDPASLPLILDEDNRLYLHRYFDYEARLARRLMQAAKTPPREVTPAAGDLLHSLFPPARDNEVDWQKIAAAMALRGSLIVISGGPGTGKTTTVVNLLACLLTQEPHTRIALAAPTGKAAARMTEAIRQRAGHLPPELRSRLPQESFTIHRLLGANPGQHRFTHDATNPLAIDALIVDEASMLDLALAARLLEAVPASARIILLGDKDQLAAVEAGAVFAELSADPTLSDGCRRDLAQLCGYAPERIAPPAPAQASPLQDVAVWLRKNYRFPADSAIGKLARYINEGRAEEALPLLRDSRAEQAKPANPALSPFALSPSTSSGQAASKGASGESVVRSKTAKKRNEDTASLSLFPELEAPSVAPAPAIAPSGNRDTSIQWLDCERGDDVLNAILAGYADYFETVRRDPTEVDAITRAFARFRVLCVLRDGASGSNSLNDQVSRQAREALSALTPGQPHDLRSPWYAGRPVMVLRNDYVNKLFNGDIGIALPFDGALAVMFPDGQGGIRAVPIARMPPHETAFAMTVHKAQGSEFDVALLLLPQQQSRVAVRELLYTGVTRAKTRVMLSARSDLLAHAMQASLKRHSGLLRRMDEPPRPANSR